MKAYVDERFDMKKALAVLWLAILAIALVGGNFYLLVHVLGVK